MCEQSDDTTLNQLTLLPEDSLARILVQQEKEPESKENKAAYGLNTKESFASYSQGTSLWRTCQRCLFGGWEEYLETWPRSGIMLNGNAYQQHTLVPRISGTGFSYWPTPRCTEATMKARRPSSELVSGKRSHGWDAVEALWDAAHTHHRTWPGIVQPGQITDGAVLNPQWWEWMMGFPAGWTDLEPSETP